MTREDMRALLAAHAPQPPWPEYDTFLPEPREVPDLPDLPEGVEIYILYASWAEGGCEDSLSEALCLDQENTDAGLLAKVAAFEPEARRGALEREAVTTWNVTTRMFSHLAAWPWWYADRVMDAMPPMPPAGRPE